MREDSPVYDADGEQIPFHRECKRHHEPGEPCARTVTITVDGPPVPKGRPRVAIRGGKPHAYTPKRTRAYEDAIGEAWIEQTDRRPFVGDVRVIVQVYEGGRAADADNYLKIALDALNTLAFEDDKQVTEASVRVTRKALEPRMVITIEELEFRW